MICHDIGMVLADTTRSKVYLQGLIQKQLYPKHVILMKSKASQLPGKSFLDESIHFSGLTFDLSQPLEKTLCENHISYIEIQAEDINEEKVIAALSEQSPSVFIFSGVGGMILRKEILNIGKKFLHVHGGYLPDFKGSTTNYYSILFENECGATSLFLSEALDSGPILIRRKFSPPLDKTKMDYMYDPIFRTRVLIETLQQYLKTGQWILDQSDFSGGEMYFIIHPFLKHVAILKDKTDVIGHL